MNRSYYASDEKKDWNINKGVGDEIARLIAEANQSSQGDSSDWFGKLRILYRCIHGHKNINEEKIKAIDKDMKDLAIKMRLLKQNLGPEIKRHIQEKVLEALDKTHIAIIDECYRSKLIDMITEKRDDLPIYRS